MDNPFFVQEVRRFARRSRRVQAVLGCCLLAMALEVLVWQYWATDFGKERGYLDAAAGFAWLLGITHLVLCSIAAGYCGSRLFVSEHLKSTFEVQQLLPLSPARWLVAKLTFPALAVLVATAAGIPIYMMAATCGLIRFEDVAGCLQKPFMAGAGILLLSLLVTPEYMRQKSRFKSGESNGRRPMNPGFSRWSSLISVSMSLSALGLMYGDGLSGRPLPFYGTSIGEKDYWFLGMVALLPASWFTARAALEPYDRQDRWAEWARAFALAVVFLGLCGFAWFAFPFWARWIVAIGVPAAQVYTQLRQSERKEDGLSLAEISWWNSHWDNPLFIHDLRVFSRHTSLRRFMGFSTLSVLLAAALLAIAANYIGGAPVMAALVLLGPQIIVMIFPSFWGRTRTLWLKEWNSHTLASLLVTPLSEEQIVLGRLLAVPAYFWAGSLPLTLALLCAFSVSSDYVDILAPVMLASCPLALSSGIWIAFRRMPRRNRTTVRSMMGDARLFLLRAGQAIVIVGCAELGMSGMSGGILGMEPGPLEVWPAAIFLFGCNAWLCRQWVRQRASVLRQLRRNDVEAFASPDEPEPAKRKTRAGFGFRVTDWG